MARDQTSFLLGLGLTTAQHSLEIKSRLKERRRRHNVSPFIFLLLDQEKQDECGAVKPEFAPKKRKRGRPRKQKLMPKQQRLDQNGSAAVANDDAKKSADADIHDAACSACKETGEVLLCDTCTRVYHLACIEPPLQAVPDGPWFCSVCKERMDETRLPELSDIVQSAELYAKYWHERDREKSRYEKMATTLRLRRQRLRQKSKMLSDTIANHITMKNDTMRNISVLQESISKMEQFIDVIKQLAHHPPS